MMYMQYYDWDLYGSSDNQIKKVFGSYKNYKKWFKRKEEIEFKKHYYKMIRSGILAIASI